MTPANQELVARLRANRVSRINPGRVLDTLANPDGPEAASEIDRLSARIGELEAGLKPFAEAAGGLDDDHLDRDDIWEFASAMMINAGHLRQARALANTGRGD